LGDPARTCAKNFVATYSCRPGTTIEREEVPAEAGFGSLLHLSCASAGEPTK
jgi:hypothetical protein